MITFALSPVVTALLSLIFRVRPPSLLGIAGIAVGLAGALIIIFSRNENFNGGGIWLILAALLIPVFLGFGNIYRTMAWPEGASPRKLASHTNLAAVPFLALIAFLQTGTIDLAPIANVLGLVAAQLAVSTTMFLMFFRLQAGSAVAQNLQRRAVIAAKIFIEVRKGRVGANRLLDGAFSLRAIKTRSPRDRGKSQRQNGSRNCVAH